MWRCCLRAPAPASGCGAWAWAGQSMSRVVLIIRRGFHLPTRGSKEWWLEMGCMTGRVGVVGCGTGFSGAGKAKGGKGFKGVG